MNKQIEYGDLSNFQNRIMTARESLLKWYKIKHSELVRADIDLHLKAARENDSKKCAKLQKNLAENKEQIELLNQQMRSCELANFGNENFEHDAGNHQNFYEQRLIATSNPANAKDNIDRVSDPETDGRKKLNGIAAPYNSRTSIGNYFFEKIKVGAFAEVLKKPDLDCRLLFNHDPNQIYGRTTNKSLRLYDVPTAGLVFWADLLKGDSASDGLIRRIERRDISGCSFCFITGLDDWVLGRPGEMPTRIIQKINKLFDIGPVTYPAYERSTVVVVKERNLVQSYEDFDDFDSQWESVQPISQARQLEINRGYRLAGRIKNRCRATMAEVGVGGSKKL